GALDRVSPHVPHRADDHAQDASPVAGARGRPRVPTHLAGRAPYGSEDLRGRVWVANFIFTSCTSSCPRLTSKMAIVQRRARNTDESVHLVSFSVDPDNDTPARLAAYAEQYHYNPLRWTFL